MVAIVDQSIGTYWYWITVWSERVFENSGGISDEQIGTETGIIVECGDYQSIYFDKKLVQL